MLTELLTARGYEVRYHVTAADALRAAGELDHDAIIVDVELPDGDGIELVRTLRDRCARRVRIVVLTGHVTAETQRRALDAGADAFLGKPVSSARLIDAIRGSRGNLT